jgi:hypothetical protein
MKWPIAFGIVRQEPEHLQPEQDHDHAGDDGQQAVDLRRERQRGTERPDRTPQQRVGEDAPRVEINVGLQPLRRREVIGRLVVFGGDGDQQSARDRDAGGDRGDEPDDEHEAVAHGVGEADRPGQEVEFAKGEKETDNDDESGADFDVVAGRVLGLDRVGLGHLFPTS